MNKEARWTSFWRRRNWWKIGFFIALFAFEFAREIAVVGGHPKAQPNITYSLYSDAGYTRAEGVWGRTDKSDDLVPMMIGIRCEQDLGSCTVVDVHMANEWVFAPNVSVFEAKFRSDSITFQEDSVCVNLHYRIDLALKKVNAIREKKLDASSNRMCKDIEERIDLTLGDSDPIGEDVAKGHFLPVLSILRFVLVDR